MADTIVAKGTKSSFTPHPEGQFLAQCVDTIDMGEKVEAFQGQPPKITPKCVLVFRTGEVNEQGQPTLLRDSKGEVVRSRLDESTLREVATATKGEYHPLGLLGEGLVRVQAALEMRAATGDGTSSKIGVDRFHFFVAGVLLLLVVESLTGTRRKTT